MLALKLYLHIENMHKDLLRLCTCRYVSEQLCAALHQQCKHAKTQGSALFL